MNGGIKYLLGVDVIGYKSTVVRDGMRRSGHLIVLVFNDLICQELSECLAVSCFRTSQVTKHAITKGGLCCSLP